MEMGLKLAPRLSQSLVMTPQLKMAIKLLTLNHLELKDAVAQELIENPMLEESYEEAAPKGADAPEAASERSKDELGPSATEVQLEKPGQEANTPEIDWEAYAESYSFLPPGAGSGRDFSHDDMPGYDQTLTRAETLEEHLVWQIQMSDMNGLERQIALRLIGEMNEVGFLDSSPQLDIDAERIKTAAEVKERKRLADKKAAEKAAKWAAERGETVETEEPDLLMDADNDADEVEDEPALLMDAGPNDNATEPALLADDGPPKAPAPVDPVELVANDLDVPVSWVENVRRRMMHFDPVGCMCRDLRECLLVQLDIWGYDDECLVYNLIDQHIEAVENRQYQQLAKELKVPLADIGEALKIIEQLEPRPTRNFLPSGEAPTQQYITPDVYIQKVTDDYVISLNEDGMPKLKVSPFYLEKLRSAARGDPSKTYIKDKMRSATWLIRSIHQRQRTIYKVCESILKYQRDWFDETGPLRPLILKEVADDIEMHESTVSRVTTRKYLHCHRGIFELKYFFNSSIATQDGTNIASESVKDEIKRIISAENPKKPLSDASIVKCLKEKNINIARRTVAKYREMLNILPSSKRKQIF